MNDETEYWKSLAYSLMVWSIIVSWKQTATSQEKNTLSEITTKQEQLLKIYRHETDSLKNLTKK